MDHNEFFALLKAGAPTGAYLLCGEEEYVKERALSALLATIEPAAFELNVQLLDNPGADDLIAACETLPFFGERRIVVAREAKLFQTSDDQSAKVAQYVQAMPPSTCLVFFERGVPPQKTLFTAISKLGRAVRFDKLDITEAVKWVLTNAKRRGAVIDAQAARRLVELVGTSMLDVSNELNKAIALAGGEPVTIAAVEACVTRNIEQSVFEMFEHFIAKRPGKGFDALYRMYSQGEVPARILSFLAGRLRIMREGKLLLSGGASPERAIKALGGSPYAARKAIEAAKRFELQTLDNALLTLSDADWAIKSGRERDNFALEAALIKIFA